MVIKRKKNGRLQSFKKMKFDINPQTQEEGEVEVLEAREHEIILYNDDVNTFDHVIRCLVRICDQTYRLPNAGQPTSTSKILLPSQTFRIAQTKIQRLSALGASAAIHRFPPVPQK